MALPTMVQRPDAEALIPVEHAREIIKDVTEGSAFLRMGRRLPNMTAKQRKLPVLTSLAEAYFVSSDTGLKGTTKAEWGDKTIDAEEIAVIVPIPDAVVADADYDLWSEIRPQLVEAIGQKIDRAVFHGESKPNTWPDGIVEQAVDKNNAVTLGTGLDMYADVLGEGGVIALVEEDGYIVNGHIAAISLRAKMRALRSNQQPVFTSAPGPQTGTLYSFDGEPLVFPRNGGIDPSKSLMISGDWTKVVYAIRQDITFEMFDQGVISDGDGKVLLNLMQQDAKALRVVFRMGWQIANPINQLNKNNAEAFAFSVLLPSGIVEE